MPRSSFARAADEVLSGMASYGLPGAILAGLVAPMMWILVKGAQKREDDRLGVDLEIVKERNARSERMLQALELTVKNQTEAMAEWRRYSAEETAIHNAIISSLDRVARKVDP